MPGILSFLQAAVGPTAAARSGYLAGQEQAADKRAAVQRQSLLDQIERRVKESEIAENEAQAKYYGRSTEPEPKLYESDQGPVLYNSQGEATPLMDRLHNRIKGPAKKKTDGLTMKEIGHYDDAGEGSVYDVDTEGGHHNSRPATATERAKFRHMPREPKDRDPNELNPNETEKYLSGIADTFVQAANGDERQAAELAVRDPRGLAAFKKGLGTGHFGAAATRYRRQQTIDTDRHNKSEADLQDMQNMGLTGSDDLGTDNGKMTKPNNSSVAKPAPRIVPPGADQPTDDVDLSTRAPATTPTAAPRRDTATTTRAPATAAPAAAKRTISQDQYEYLVTPTENGGAGLTPAQVRARYNVKP